jgi:alpha-mannosidase
MAFNRPMGARMTGSLAGPDTSWLRVEGDGSVVCSALRRAEHSDGVLVRLYETEGRRAAVRLRFGRTGVSAADVDFMERPRARLPKVHRGVLRLTFRPNEIKTILVRAAG